MEIFFAFIPPMLNGVSSPEFFLTADRWTSDILMGQVMMRRRRRMMMMMRRMRRMRRRRRMRRMRRRRRRMMMMMMMRRRRMRRVRRIRIHPAFSFLPRKVVKRPHPKWTLARISFLIYGPWAELVTPEKTP